MTHLCGGFAILFPFLFSGLGIIEEEGVGLLAVPKAV
jgi:hypothetical protein